MSTSRSTDDSASSLRRTVRIVPEVGMILLAGIAVLVLLALYLGAYTMWFSVPLWLLACASFLERESYLPKSPLALASPVAGRVIDVRRARDLWLDRDCWKLSIRPSWLVVGSIYSATEGRCGQQWCRRKGGCSSFVSHVSTDEGDDVVVEVSSRLSLGYRLRINYQIGDRVGQGQRVGYMFFAGTVYVYAPISAKCLTQPGQCLSAAEPVLELVHSKPASIMTAAEV